MASWVSGSPAFRTRVNEALDVWQEADPEHFDALLGAVQGIHEHDDKFKVLTGADGIIRMADSVAWWPQADPELQIRILATYLAHEGYHALALEKEDVHWNDGIGEAKALQYQREIGRRLNVPMEYVMTPHTTLFGKVLAAYASTVQHLGETGARLAFLAGAAAVLSLASSQVRRSRRGRGR